MPNPTLVLPLWWWQTVSHLKLFHALPMAWIWHHLTSGYLQFSRNISKEFILHVMKRFKLLWKNAFKKSLKLSTSTGLKVLFRYYMEKYGTETKYTFWATFYFLFILIPCLVVKIQYRDITSWTSYVWSYKCIPEISLLYDAVYAIPLTAFWKWRKYT